MGDNDHFEGDTYRGWREQIRPTLEARAERYVADLVALTGAAPKSAVEVGCATGETVAALTDRGAEAWGVDMSEVAIETAREWFPRGHFQVAKLPDPDRVVDVAVMIHVVEHLPDPVETLKELRNLVHPEGWLYLRCPNYAGLAPRTLRGAWPDFMVDHVHYFTPESMRAALRSAGWEPVAVRTASASWPWLGGAKRLLTRQRPGASAGGHAAPPPPRLMRLLAVADRVLAPVLRIEARRGRGNELIVMARKRTATP